MASHAPPSAATPPTSAFSVWQRVFRGYGPLAVFAVLLVVMALVVPSTVPKTTGLTAASTGSGTAYTPGQLASGSSSASGPASTAGTHSSTSSSSKVTTPGGSVTSGASGSTTAPGVVSSCAGEQVPGDPYSPPCISFSGSNGGATSKGVTANAINISYRVTDDQSFQQTLAQLAGASLQDTNADTERTITTLAQYFNTHFQFYGRKMVINFFNGQGSLTNELQGNGQAQADADALTVGQQMKAFGDISAESEPYADALERQGVLGFGDPYMSAEWHEQHAPYDWSIAVDGTVVASLSADYALQKLCPAGTPAAYAGGSLKNAPRKFATLAPENSFYQESVDVSRNMLTQGGCNPGDNVEYALDLGTESNQATNIIAKLQSDGVTTILCGCDPIIPVFLSGVAARQNYFPEFIITGTALTDADIVGQLWNPAFTAHAFGISPSEAEVPSTQTVGYEAYKTVRSDEPAFYVDLIYEQMDMLAIGLQMAGPDLTPENFMKGMFAYPAKLGPDGLWQFSPSEFTAPDDVREICWSPTTISPYNQKEGAYIGTSNARWTLGQIPKGPPGCPIPTS